MLLLLALLGCTGDKDGTDTDTDGVETDTPTETSVPTGDTADTTPPTSCEEDPSLTVQATAAGGQVPNQIALTVTTSSPAVVAATCTNDADLAEVHLAESEGARQSHELRFMGLLQDTSYTCRAVATCPESSAPSAPVTHRTGAASSELPQLGVQVDPSLGMTGYYTLAPWLEDGCAHFQSKAWLVMWDQRGRARWWWPMPGYMDVEAHYDPATRRIGWGGGTHPAGGYNEIDLWTGTVYEASLPDWDGNKFSHDGYRESTDRVVTLQLVDNHDPANPTRVWDGFGIRAIDPTDADAITFQFDSQQMVEDAQLAVPPAGFKDPYHANWVKWFESPRGPELYVSLCFSQQIVAIDGDDGSVLWQLGVGKGWTVLDADGDPIDETQLPQCQHGVDVLGDGRFLVYDNGQIRGQSSVSEWSIDGVAKTAQRVWYWTEADWSEPFLGDADDLGNDRVLLTQGSVGCPERLEPGEELNYSRITEVDRATGRVASRLVLPELIHGTYRSQRIDGCEIFADAQACPAVAERITALAPLFTE